MRLKFKKKILNVKNQKNKTTTKTKTNKNNKNPKRNSQRQKTKKNKKENHSIFPKDFSHVFYLFPYRKLLGIIHLCY